MNTLHLKYAIEVERTRSITQAAENLFMGQPNLSKAIKELEDTLGFAIFERTSKGVVPTVKGSEFLVYAHNVLIEIEKMEELSKPANSDMQTFKISIPRGSYIASAFTRFVAELDTGKGMDVNVQETNSVQVINNIDERQFNIGIIRYQTVYENYFLDYLKSKQLCYNPIWEFEYLVLMSEKHELAAVPEISYDCLKLFTEIVDGDMIIPYLSSKGSQKQAKASENTKKIYLYERCNQFELLSNIPTTFMWVSPIPAELLERYHLVQRKCSAPTQKFKDVLIYPEGYKFTSLEEKFIDKLFKIKNEVSIQEYK